MKPSFLTACSRARARHAFERIDAGKPAEPVGPAGDSAADNLIGKVITARQTLPPRLGRDQEGAFDSGRIHARNHLIESATKRQLWTGLDPADPDRDETVAAALVVVQVASLKPPMSKLTRE